MKQRFVKSFYVLALTVIMSINVAINVSAANIVGVKVNGSIKYDEAFSCLDILNRERAAVGLDALTMDQQLMDVAVTRAYECCVYFDHTRPNGQSCTSLQNTNTYFGENIAAGYSNATYVMQGWMSSSGHKANILNPNYNSVGIACVNGVWVQEFSGNTSYSASQPSNRTEVRSVECDTSAVSIKPSYYYSGTQNVKEGDKIQLYAPLLYIYGEQCFSVDDSAFSVTSSNSSIASVSGMTLSVLTGGDFAVTFTLNGTNLSTTVNYHSESVVRTTYLDSNSSVNLEYNSVTYEPSKTFTPRVLEVRLTDGSVVPASNYTVGYANNDRAGTATVTITGIGNCSGTKTTTFSINPKSVQSLNISSIPDQSYTGSSIYPSVTVKDGSKTLSEGIDYNAYYSNNTDPGAANVTIYGTGNYTGSKAVTFKIVSQSANEFSVSPIEDVTYTGLKMCPIVTVKCGSKTLREGIDYTVSYSDNVNAGIAKVTIIGKGSYNGTKTASFKINAKDIKNTYISAISDQIYTGSAITPNITVRDNGKALIKGTDYTVSYSNNTKAGTASIIVAGKDNYTGTSTDTFKIVSKAIGNFKISAIADKTYTGYEIEPYVRIENGNRLLVEGYDYSVSYYNNIYVGKATVTVTGKGEYSGVGTVDFKIVPKNIKDVSISDIWDCEYTGSPRKPMTIVRDGAINLNENTDYTVSYENNTNKGTAKVTIKGIGNYTGTTTKSFKIIGNAAGDFKVSAIADQTYTGNEIKPSVTVKDGNKTLTKGTDYTVTYYNHTYVGTASAVVTGKGDYSGTVTVDFEIVPKSIKFATILNIPDQTYTGSSIKPEVTVCDGRITLGENFDYTVSYSNNTNKGTAKVTIKGIGNYTGTATTSFKIAGDKEITDVSIIFTPNKTIYELNERLDLTGGVILVSYSNGTSDEIGMTDRRVTASGFNSSRVGTSTVTLKYNGKSMTFTVSVIDNNGSDNNDEDISVVVDDDVIIKGNYEYDSSVPICLHCNLLPGDGQVNAKDLNAVFRYIDSLQNKNAVYSISLNKDITVGELEFPTYAKAVRFIPCGSIIRTSSTKLEPKCDLFINTTIVNTSGKAIDITMPANTSLTFDIYADIKIGNLKGTSTTSLFVNKRLEVFDLTKFNKVVTYYEYLENTNFVSTGEVYITVTGKATGIKNLYGKLNIKGYGSKHPVNVTNVVKGEIVLTKGSKNTIAPVTVKDVKEWLYITIVNSKGKTVKINPGLCIAKTNGNKDISSKISVFNNGKDGKYLVTTQNKRKIRVSCSR